MEAKDIGVTPEEFEKNMQELVTRGLMKQTGPGTYAITERGEKSVDAMPIAARQRVTIDQLATKIDEANQQRRGLIKAAKATLLFHSGAPWTPQKSAEWRELTGGDDATSHALCNFVRTQLERAE